MTIDDFRTKVTQMAHARMGLDTYGDYLRHKSRDDKYLREEHLAILAVVDHKAIPGHQEIELGNETEAPDALIAGTDSFEVVQALPESSYPDFSQGEHQIRREIAAGGAKPATYWAHANDHLQFPEVIIKAIESKHKKTYTDSRSLIVVVDGDYTFEDDGVIETWLPRIRERTHLGNFKEILLVERARQKVFQVF